MWYLGSHLSTRISPLHVHETPTWTLGMPRREKDAAGKIICALQNFYRSSGSCSGV